MEKPDSGRQFSLKELMICSVLIVVAVSSAIRWMIHPATGLFPGLLLIFSPFVLGGTLGFAIDRKQPARGVGFGILLGTAVFALAWLLLSLVIGG